MRHLRLLTALLLLSSVVLAQSRQVSGIVRDSKTQDPLPAVTVKVTGANIQTTTDDNGAFTLNVPTGSATLEISSVGYGTSTLALEADQTSITIALDATSANLSEVVVTALGISKDAKKLGYAVTKVGGESINKARETNVALSLAGQVAGLNVKGTAGGPASSARILLRGMPSMNGGGAPLFVIDGIPMDNTQRGSAGEWGGADNGDGIGNINPDDIESMTVLKGQSASALYGARASNGVILITTKKGKKGDFLVEFNSNYLAEKAIDFTDFQYEYGQGEFGTKPATVADAQKTGRLSWGAPLDGSQVIQFDGKEYPYVAQTDNIESFYRTGPTWTNTVAVSGGGDNGTFRLSLSNLDNKSILRNSGLDRKTINLNIDQKITSKLNVNIMANYIDEQSKNKAQMSDGPMNANNGIFLATNIDQKVLAPGYNPNTNDEVVFSDDIYVTNPWFVVNQYVNNVGRKRLISAVTSRYNFTDWIYAQGRVGYDLLNDRLFKVEPTGTAYTQDRKGNLQDLASQQTQELNIDGLVGLTRPLTKDINLDAAVGANLRKNQSERIKIGGGPFVIPYQYSWNNVTNFNRDYTFLKSEVHSAYYTLDFTFREYLTLSTTGRYDAYSTLPSSARTIFTPSVSASLIFSDLVNVNNLDYGKFRASYAQTSGDPGAPYRTSVYYSIGNTLNGLSTGSFGGGLPNTTLKPFTLTEYEVGTELKFLSNRLGLDVAYFHRTTNNEIMNASLSPTSGYTSGFIGTGSTQNQGIEVLLTGAPVRKQNFEWNVSFNLTSVKNRILETDAIGNPVTLGTYRPLNANTAFIKGLAGPQIRAYDYKYDAKGDIIVDASGLPVRGELVNMGSVLPTLYGGLNNNFSYKAFNLSFLIDYNYGNKVLSATNYYSVFRGLHQMTLEGRETGITTGVLEDGAVNTTTARAQDYYQQLARNVSTINVLKGDFIKLRQVTIGYNISEKALSGLPLFRSIQLSLVGRNLLTFKKYTDNIDPEAGFSSLVNYAGIEGTGLPTTRSFGINANFKFKK